MTIRLAYRSDARERGLHILTLGQVAYGAQPLRASWTFEVGLKLCEYLASIQAGRNVRSVEWVQSTSGTVGYYAVPRAEAPDDWALRFVEHEMTQVHEVMSAWLALRLLDA